MPPFPERLILLASSRSDLLDSARAAFSGDCLQTACDSEAALAVINSQAPPSIAFLDAELPQINEISFGRLLAAARATGNKNQILTIAVATEITEDLRCRLDEGVFDDLIARSLSPDHLRLRLEASLYARERRREIEVLRDAAADQTQLDSLTGALNRSTLLSMLFRETDRVQRMKTCLSLMVFEVDDFSHWKTRLGEALCDQLLSQVATRTRRLLRSYDLMGRAAHAQFLMALPGCGVSNATMLAERIRIDVFSTPFEVDGQHIRLSASFGINSSEGRSPMIVVRETEVALEQAKAEGPDMIRCFAAIGIAHKAPAAFLSLGCADEALVW